MRMMKDPIKTFIPVDYRLILYGWAIGLLFGTLAFTESAERAAIVGIAAFLTVSVGGFIGIKISFLTMRAFLAWTGSIKDRIYRLTTRLGDLTGQSVPESASKEMTARGFSVIRVYVALTILGISLLTQGVVGGVIELGVDVYDTRSYIAVLILGSLFASIGIGGQAIQLIGVSRSITQMERQLDAITTGIPIPVSAVPQRMDLAIQNTQSWVCKLTGVCADSAEPVVA